MHVILTDPIMEDLMSIKIIKKTIKNNNLTNLFEIINIDRALIINNENKIKYLTITGEEKEILLSDIDSITPRVDRYTTLYQSFIQFCSQKKTLKIFNKNLQMINNKFLSFMKISEFNYIKAIPTKQLNKINVDSIDSFPVIIKTCEGYSGLEVFLVKTKKELVEIYFENKDKDLIIQPYRIHGNVDYRAIVSNGKVISAYKRTAPDNSFKANASSGGEIEYLKEIDKNLEKIALDSAKALKADFVGIDFLFDGENYEFCEANNSFRIRQEEQALEILKSYPKII